MKKLRFTAFALIIALSVLLISGCAKQTISQQDDSELMQNDLTAEQDNAKYEKLTFDWVDKDIKEIALRRQQYAYAITDKKDIEKLVEYITDAKVISKEEIARMEGWTYAIKVTLENGEYYWVELGNSYAECDKDNETGIVYTVETDYFKPLIEKMGSDLLRVY